MDEELKKKRIFTGEAKIGEVVGGFQMINLSPEDLSSPVRLQMALTRIYEGLMKSLAEGPKKKYMAEVRFKDDTGRLVIVAVDLGEAAPPFSKDTVKANVIIELYEEE